MLPAPGAAVGPYTLVARLGRGGMGEVWRASDPRVNREVAIKFAAERFSDRFQREARAIAALNHPNLCTLFDVGPDYLVMELVEGPTLSERIRQGPIPFAEASALALQIAAALDAAHQRGIVHRDLKPDNIKIRPDGTVKVLDFGLARTPADAPGDADPAESPTTLTALSSPGMIVGTAAYMAPEQARGAAVDKRADIWAFGVVFYEMLCGGRLFAGDTVSDILAAVLTREPDWTELPAAARPLLRACLQRDAGARLRDIADAKLLLASPLETDGPAAAPRSPFRRWPYVAVSAAGIALAAALVARDGLRPVSPAPVVKSALVLPDAMQKYDGNVLALAPDARSLVVQANNQLWLRRLDSEAVQALAGTTGATYPFWSPDSQSLGFAQGGALKILRLDTGLLTTLAPAPHFRGGSWAPDGTIVFAPDIVGPLQRVSAAGGRAVAATQLAAAHPSSADSHRWPRFLPDGRHFLYVQVVSDTNQGTLHVAALDGSDGSKGGEDHILGATNSNAAYDAGHLLFVRDQTLVAVPFDPSRLEVTGNPVPVAAQVQSSSGSAYAAFDGHQGMVVYHPGRRGLMVPSWFERNGTRSASFGDPAALQHLRLAPDGAHAVAVVLDGVGADLWIYDLARNVRTRFTFDDHTDRDMWSGDGRQILYMTRPAGASAGIFRRAADGSGSAQLVLAGNSGRSPESWSRDGKFLLYAGAEGLWVLPVGQPDAKPRLFLRGASEAEFSPDGHWVAYTAGDSGRVEIFLTPFPGPGGKYQVSANGGLIPRWRGDGRELYYIAPGGELTAVPVALKPDAAVIGRPQTLFGGFCPGQECGYDPAPDGQRFLMLAFQDSAQANPPLQLIQNWPAALVH